MKPFLWTKEMKKLVYGVGTNDADYKVHAGIKGSKRVMCRYYSVWASMLERCYADKSSGKNITYNGCFVANEWHIFSNFKLWMETQDHIGKQLDKDLLFQGNKIYSKETCIFVDCNINTLFLDCSLVRGKYPLGVNKNRNKLTSRVWSNGKRVHLGMFICTEKAHAAWQNAKIEIIERAANEQTNERVKSALMLRVKQLRDDLASGRETIKL